MKLGYSSDNRQDCTHCRFYLKDTPFQNDTAKLQLFHKPAKGWRKFYYNELSLVVCFTRIAVNVPRIVINCLGDIASGCRWLQQPCHACMGLCGGGHLWLRPIIVIRLIMKTRHCISGCGRVNLIYAKQLDISKLFFYSFPVSLFCPNSLAFSLLFASSYNLE
jgi:hypothetical protein